MSEKEKLLELMEELEDAKARARFLAMSNPIGFLVSTGVYLPEYIKKIEEGQAVLRQLIDKSQAGAANA